MNLCNRGIINKVDTIIIQTLCDSLLANTPISFVKSICGMKSTLVTALVLNLIHAYIPSEKFQSICQSKGGDLHAHFKVDGIHFAQLNGKTAPYTKDLYICLKKGSSPANLSSIVIPIGGAPAVWLEPSNDEERFKSSCRGACGGDFQTATVTFKGETLGACQCYDKYPYSPMFTDKKSVHETTDDGVAPGGLVPKDPHTFQTCSEFSAKSPVQGLLNMACLCVKNPWPFPDFSGIFIPTQCASGLAEIQKPSTCREALPYGSKRTRMQMAVP